MGTRMRFVVNCTGAEVVHAVKDRSHYLRECCDILSALSENISELSEMKYCFIYLQTSSLPTMYSGQLTSLTEVACPETHQVLLLSSENYKPQ